MYTERCTIFIEISKFHNNTGLATAALSLVNSIITIYGSEFKNNTATERGGAMFSEHSTVTTRFSDFQNNSA